MLAAITTGDLPGAGPVTGRLDIYARGYMARLVKCLKAEFPTLLAHTGETVFDLFATAYIRANPPASYSLFDLGAGFPDFLERTRPKGDTGPAGALPAALATLDRLESHR